MAPAHSAAVPAAVVPAVTGLPSPVICLVTDRRRLSPGAGTNAEVEELERLLDEAVDEGVDLIQVRERDLAAGLLCRLVRRVVHRATGTGVRVVVNDRADVALAAGSDGVHLRADSAPAARVRALSPGWIIGRSIHAGDAGEPDPAADYLILGTLFPTASKPDARGAGVEALAALARSTSRPVLAIGGITPEHARACRSAGAAGIAAIEAFLPEGSAPGALGVREAVRAFRAAMA